MPLFGKRGKNPKPPKGYPHGQPFSGKMQTYFDIEDRLKLILDCLSAYTSALSELAKCKTQIYAQLLWFYNNTSKKDKDLGFTKRDLLEKLYKHHDRGKLRKNIDRLQSDYQSDLETEILDILKIFPKTRNKIPDLDKQKKKWQEKLQDYQSLKRSNKKQNEDYFAVLAQKDEEARTLENQYEIRRRKMVREFDAKIRTKDQMLDRFCIRMFESDGHLFSDFFKTSSVLRKQCLAFQRLRDYPEGFPSFFRDYSYGEDLQDSSDDSIDKPPANDFYSNATARCSFCGQIPQLQNSSGGGNNAFTAQIQPNQMLTILTNHFNFDEGKVIRAMKLNPGASYEKLLEILTNVKRPTSAQPSSQRSPPKPGKVHIRSRTVQSMAGHIPHHVISQMNHSGSSQYRSPQSHVGSSKSTSFLESPHLSPDIAPHSAQTTPGFPPSLELAQEMHVAEYTARMVPIQTPTTSKLPKVPKPGMIKALTHDPHKQRAPRARGQSAAAAPPRSSKTHKSVPIYDSPTNNHTANGSPGSPSLGSFHKSPPPSGPPPTPKRPRKPPPAPPTPKQVSATQPQTSPQNSPLAGITPLDDTDIAYIYGAANKNKTPTNTPAVDDHDTVSSPSSMNTKRASPALVISPKLLNQIRAEGARRSETFSPKSNHQLQSIIRGHNAAASDSISRYEMEMSVDASRDYTIQEDEEVNHPIHSPTATATATERENTMTTTAIHVPNISIETTELQHTHSTAQSGSSVRHFEATSSGTVIDHIMAMPMLNTDSEQPIVRSHSAQSDSLIGGLDPDQELLLEQSPPTETPASVALSNLSTVTPAPADGPLMVRTYSKAILQPVQRKIDSSTDNSSGGGGGGGDGDDEGKSSTSKHKKELSVDINAAVVPPKPMRRNHHRSLSSPDGGPGMRMWLKDLRQGSVNMVNYSQSSNTNTMSTVRGPAYVSPPSYAPPIPPSRKKQKGSSGTPVPSRRAHGHTRGRSQTGFASPTSSRKMQNYHNVHSSNHQMHHQHANTTPSPLDPDQDQEEGRRGNNGRYFPGDIPSDRSDDSTSYPTKIGANEQFMPNHFRRSQTMDLTATQSEKLGDTKPLRVKSRDSFNLKKRSSRNTKHGVQSRSPLSSSINSKKSRSGRKRKQKQRDKLNRSKSPHVTSTNSKRHAKDSGNGKGGGFAFPHRRQRSQSFQSSKSSKASSSNKKSMRSAMENGVKSRFADREGSNGSDNSTSSKRSTSHEIQESQTAYVDQQHDGNDSLHEFDPNNLDQMDPMDLLNDNNQRMKPRAFRERIDTDEVQEHELIPRRRLRKGSEGSGMMDHHHDAMDNVIPRSNAISDFMDDDDEDPRLPDLETMRHAHSEQKVKLNPMLHARRHRLNHANSSHQKRTSARSASPNVHRRMESKDERARKDIQEILSFEKRNAHKKGPHGPPKRVRPWIWNRNKVSSKGKYRYPRSGTNGDMAHTHPLSLDLTKIQNFKYLHELMNPGQFRHIGEPNSAVKPNQILSKYVTVKEECIHKLKVEPYIVDGLKEHYQREKQQKPIHAKQMRKTTQPLRGGNNTPRTSPQRRPRNKTDAAVSSMAYLRRTDRGTPKAEVDANNTTIQMNTSSYKAHKSVKERRLTSGIPPNAKSKTGANKESKRGNRK